MDFMTLINMQIYLFSYQFTYFYFYNKYQFFNDTLGNRLNVYIAGWKKLLIHCASK